MNPFPGQATTNVEVSTGERFRLASPYLPLPVSEAAFARLSAARAQMIECAELRARGQELETEVSGDVIAIRGPHGTGKTRLIAEMMSLLASDTGPAATLVLYAKCDLDGPAALLHRLLGQLGFEDFRKTLHSAQIALTSQAAPSSISGQIASRSSPLELEPVYTSYVVGRDVIDAKLRERSPSTSRGDEFRTAISSSQEPALTPIVHRWLIGGSLDKESLQNIGVNAVLASAEALLSSICLVLSLRVQARLPTFVFIDQIEHFAADEIGLHVIRTLVEWIPRHGGLLVLAGNEVVYGGLARDLIARFEGLIDLRRFTESEARELIRRYLEATREFRIDEMFDDEAINAISQVTSGNPRRILQLCHRCFEIATQRTLKIDRARVEEAALPAGVSVHAIVEHLRSVVYRAGFQLGEVGSWQLGSCDCPITDGAGVEIAWVFIRASEFYLDETRTMLDAIRDARRLAVGCPLLFVTAGYVSPEIKRLMQAESIDYVEYDPWDLERVVKSIALDRRARRVATTIARAGERDTRLERVEEALTSIGERRDVDLALLGRDIKATVKVTVQPEVEGWASERPSILEQIDRERAVRSMRAREEFVHEYHAARRSRLVQLFLLLLVAMAASGAVAALQELYVTSFTRITGTVSGLAVILGTVYVMATHGLRLLQSSLGVGAGMEEIEIAARRLVRYGRADIRSRDPLWRLAAALRIKGKWSDPGDIISLIKTETSAVVRRELILALSSAPRDIVVSGVLSLCDGPDCLYLVEVIVRVFPELPDALQDIESDALRTLYALYGHRPARWSSELESDLLYSLVARRFVDNNSTQLCRAYYDDDEVALLDVAGRISSERLEEMAARLSPFERGGLGTADALRRIRQIDSYYVFVRKLLFIRERQIRSHHA